jgi:hypothetical protein
VSGKLDEQRLVLHEQQLDRLEAAITATLRDFGIDASSYSVRQASAAS